LEPQNEIGVTNFITVAKKIVYVITILKCTVHNSHGGCCPCPNSWGTVAQQYPCDFFIFDFFSSHSYGGENHCTWLNRPSFVLPCAEKNLIKKGSVNVEGFHGGYWVRDMTCHGYCDQGI
jgi:hypothetical protein